jgi:hypothetical protein
MGCPAEVIIGDSLVFSITTHDPDTGILTDADAVPSYRIYEDETATALLTGVMALLDTANTTGFYSKSVDCTAANGFENGKTYSVYIEATVDGDKGGICYGFKAKSSTGIRKNTAQANFSFLMVDSTDHITAETGLSSFTSQGSIDGAAFASLSGAVSEVGFGMYKIDLTAAELNGDLITLRFSASGADTRIVTIKTNA